MKSYFFGCQRVASAVVPGAGWQSDTLAAMEPRWSNGVAVGAGIGLVTGGILGGIGEAITNEALKNVYATALIAAGVGNTAHGFAEGQAITASVGAAMLALGLVAGFAHGANGLSQEQQLRGNAGAFDQRYRIGGVTYGGREAAGGSWLGTIG